MKTACRKMIEKVKALMWAFLLSAWVQNALSYTGLTCNCDGCKYLRSKGPGYTRGWDE